MSIAQLYLSSFYYINIDAIYGSAKATCLHGGMGGGPRVVVNTAAFHARVRGSVPGLGGLKETKMFLPHPRVKVSIVGSLRDREVAGSASDRQDSNFESRVWRHLTILKKSIQVTKTCSEDNNKKSLFKPHRSHLSTFKTPKGHWSIQTFQLKFYFKLTNQLLPQYFYSFDLKTNHDIHLQRHNLHITRVKHEFAKRCIRYQLPSEINLTPALITDK